jgi:imidazolonepropionase-like amidohydrolase
MSGSAAGVRNLPYAAAMAVSHGLPEAAAMRALTLGAAEALGIAKTHGTLYPGKVADIVLYRGSPLDARLSPEHVFIRGRHVQLESRHTRLARPFMTR